ncbi:hypothetical protein HC239_10535, partial [Streptococcus suis]|nr:hypothetical protein [Streptococcus suis]
MVHSTTNKMTWTRVVMLLTLLFGTIVSTFSVQSVAAAELTPVISNLQQETVANTYRISFDYNLSGLAAKSGDTFTIDLPAELETANLIPFDVTQNGVVIGQAVPSGDKVTVTFNDAVTGDTNGSGSMAFNVIFKTQPTEGETITAEVTVGTESIVIKKTGTVLTPK